MTSLTVRVPASTSNLGPGFDCLGLALSLWLDVTWTAASDRLEVHAEHEDWPASADDLLPAAFTRAARALDVPVAGRLTVRSEIPIGRGFGSTGAATAAGLLLANALARSPVERRALLPFGVELEGHPDNVTASLFGGCTLCHPTARDGAPVFVACPVAPLIGAALAWPAAPLETPRARAALPAEVAFADAVENPRRLGLLLEGLRSGDAELLALGSRDFLHERHRLPLIAGAREGLDAARAAGAWLATLSGAGSGLVALGPPDRSAQIADAMGEALRTASGAGTGRTVTIVRDAPEVVPAE